MTHLRILREDVVHQPFVPGTQGPTAAAHTCNENKKPVSAAPGQADALGPGKPGDGSRQVSLLAVQHLVFLGAWLLPLLPDLTLCQDTGYSGLRSLLEASRLTASRQKQWTATIHEVRPQRGTRRCEALWAGLHERQVHTAHTPVTHTLTFISHVPSQGCMLQQ